MSDGVRERLAHRMMQCQRGVGAKRSPGARLAQPHVGRGSAHALDELLQGVDGGQRLARGIVGDDRTHSAQSLTAGVHDDPESSVTPVGVLGAHRAGDLGLRDHHRHRVRDDVVQVAVDPSALIRDRLRDARRHPLLGLVAPHPQDQPQRPGRRDRAAESEERPEAELRIVESKLGEGDEAGAEMPPASASTRTVVPVCAATWPMTSR